MHAPAVRATWLEGAARRKNGLNFQVFLSGTLVCLSSVPLVLAFAFPILSLRACGLFLLGMGMAYGAWPLFCAGIEGRRRLLIEAAAMDVRYVELDRAARRLVPAIARRLLPRLA